MSEINEVKKIIFEERYPNISEAAKSIWTNDIERSSEEVLKVIGKIFGSCLQQDIIEELAFEREKLEELEMVCDLTTDKLTLKYRGVILATSKESEAYKNFNNYKLIDQLLNEGSSPELINAGIKTGKKNEKGWEIIHSDFADESYILGWKGNGFEYEQVEKWVTIAKLDADDYDFAKWLRDEKCQTKEEDGDDWGNLEWISKFKDINDLRDEFFSRSLTMKRISTIISEGAVALEWDADIESESEKDERENLAVKLQKESEENERLENFLREREEAHENLIKDYEAKEKEQKEKDAKIKDLVKKETERENHIKELEVKLEKLEEERKNASQTLITTKANYVEAEKEQKQEQILVVNQIEEENFERIKNLQEKLSLSKEEINGYIQTINHLQAHLHNIEFQLQDDERLIAKLNRKIEDLIWDKIDENEWNEKYGEEDDDDKTSDSNHSRRTSSISTLQLGKTWLEEVGGPTCSSPVNSRSASPTKANFYHVKDNSGGSSFHHLRDNSNSSRASLRSNASSASLSLDELVKKMRILRAELGRAKKNQKTLKTLLGFKNIEDLEKKLNKKNLNDLLKDLNQKQKLISLLSQNPQATISSSSQSGKKKSFIPFKKKETNELQASDLVSQVRQTYLDTLDRVEKGLVQLIKSEAKEGLNEEAKNEFGNIIGIVSPFVKEAKELKILLAESQKEIANLRSRTTSPIPIPHLSTLSVADSACFVGSPSNNGLTAAFSVPSEGYFSDSEQLTQVLEKKQERNWREKVEGLERELSLLKSENDNLIENGKILEKNWNLAMENLRLSGEFSESNETTENPGIQKLINIKEKEITQKLIGDLGLEIERNSTLNEVIEFIKELIRQPIIDTSENTNEIIEDLNEELSEDLTNISQSSQNDDYEKLKREEENLKKQLRLSKRELLAANKKIDMRKAEVNKLQENLNQKEIEERTKLQVLNDEIDKFEKLWKEAKNEIIRMTTEVVLKTQIEIPVK